MANYYGTTVSEGGKIKEGHKEEVNKIIERYTFGELNVEVGEELAIYGADSFFVYKREENGEVEDYDNVAEDFLNEIASHLATPLVVSEVGNEKCRYVAAYAFIVKPDMPVQFVSLDEAIDAKLNA